MGVQRDGIHAIRSCVFSDRGNADMRMWCRHVQTAEIRSVVSDNDTKAESDVPYSYLK